MARDREAMIILILSRLRVPLVVLGWGTSLAALTLGTIFQGYLLPTTEGGLLPQVYGASPAGLWVFYLGSFGISAVAAMVIYDAGPAIVAFFFAFGLTASLTATVLALPELIGTIQTNGVLQETSILNTFSALFPLALIVNLVGTLVGIALGERLLYSTDVFSV